MNKNFALTYWKTLNQLNQSSPTGELNTVLNSENPLNETQVDYIKNIPQVDNLFRFEQSFQNNPNLVQEFIAKFPYSRVNSAQGNNMVLQDIVGEFIPQLELSENVTTTRVSSETQVVTPSTTQESKTENLASAAESLNLNSAPTTNVNKTNTEQEATIQLNQKSESEVMEGQFRLSFPSSEKVIESELLNDTQPDQQTQTQQPDEDLIPADSDSSLLNINDLPNSLQEAKQEYTEAEQARQESLRQRGVPERNQQQPRSAPVQFQGGSPFQSRASRRFRNSVLGWSFGTAGATGGLFGYLTLLT